MGTENEWNQAESILNNSLSRFRNFQIKAGDGAFYGPKIDFQIKNEQGKDFQLATLQLGFQLPSNFKLRYRNDKGELKKPVLIHRALLGSFERFLAVWMERNGGRWPFWCNPRQCLIIPVSEKYLQFANSVKKDLTCKFENDPQNRT